MDEELIAVVEQHGNWIVAYLPERPTLRGQGTTQDEALRHLAAQLQAETRTRRGSPPVQSLTVRMRSR